MRDLSISRLRALRREGGTWRWWFTRHCTHEGFTRSVPDKAASVRLRWCTFCGAIWH